MPVIALLLLQAFIVIALAPHIPPTLYFPTTLPLLFAQFIISFPAISKEPHIPPTSLEPVIAQPETLQPITVPSHSPHMPPTYIFPVIEPPTTLQLDMVPELCPQIAPTYIPAAIAASLIIRLLTFPVAPIVLNNGVFKPLMILLFPSNVPLNSTLSQLLRVISLVSLKTLPSFPLFNWSKSAALLIRYGSSLVPSPLSVVSACTDNAVKSTQRSAVARKPKNFLFFIVILSPYFCLLFCLLPLLLLLLLFSCFFLLSSLFLFFRFSFLFDLLIPNLFHISILPPPGQ